MVRVFDGLGERVTGDRLVRTGVSKPWPVG